MAVWGTDIDIMVHHSGNPTAPGCINVLFDWNQDGRWKGADTCYAGGVPTTVPEHVLVDIPIPPGFSGAISALAPAPFAVGPNTDYIWTRFTVSPVPVGYGWDGSGVFDDGESEDYLLHVTASWAGAQGGYEPPQFHLYPGKPNPFTGESMIRFELPYPQRVRVAVYEASGRLVRVLFDGIKPAGLHEVSWDGADAAGRAVGAGIYFCRMESAPFAATGRLVVVR
jgi:hypothetical protein